MMNQLKKRVALVTGATGGLGTAICKKLVSDGYLVVGNYRNEEKARAWQKGMKDEGYEVEIFEGDVADFLAVGKMVKEIEEKVNAIR